MAKIIDPPGSESGARGELMLQTRIAQALSSRRRALHKLRIGDRFGHRECMDAAFFYLKLARQWKVKQ